MALYTLVCEKIKQIPFLTFSHHDPCFPLSCAQSPIIPSHTTQGLRRHTMTQKSPSLIPTSPAPINNIHRNSI